MVLSFGQSTKGAGMPAPFSRVHEAAHTPAGVVTRQDDPTLTRARATVLAKTIHHALRHQNMTGCGQIGNVRGLNGAAT
jgi:hypothetical protein